MVGERIRLRRNQLGLSQEEVAEGIGTSQKQVSKYETGVNSPSSEVLARLADVLDVSMDWLVGRTERMIPPLDSLTDDERAVVRLIRSLPPERRERIKDVIGLMR